MTQLHAHNLQVFADYFQLYLWDEGTDPQAPEDYTDDDLRNRVKVAPHVVVIQPVRNMAVPVRLEVHEIDPGADLAPWDHVVECSLDLPTGHLQVHECTGSAKLELQLAPGTYRVRVFFGALATLSPSGLEGQDHYLVIVWPGESQPLRIVKRFPLE